MKGLKEYLARHGRHLTERLVMDSIKIKWNTAEVMETSETMVYYNVTGSTVGDMVYLANEYHARCPKHHKARCVRYALETIGDAALEGHAFDRWLERGCCIDLVRYI